MGSHGVYHGIDRQFYENRGIYLCNTPVDLRGLTMDIYGYLWIMVICRTEVRTLVREFGCAPWALGENSNH